MTVHESILKQARRNDAVIRSAIGKVGQERIADLIGCSGSTVHAFKTEQMERLCAVLAACGLKVVPSTDESVTADEIWALRILAIKRMEDGRQEQGDSNFGSL